MDLKQKKEKILLESLLKEIQNLISNVNIDKNTFKAISFDVFIGVFFN